jgi:class 3 adenylate cyclase
MGETRKLAAILVADVVGYSRLAGADEDRTLARLRGLRSDLIDPAIAAHHGRIIKRTGDGSIIEFRSVVDAVRCALEVQTGMVERNAGLPPERRIEFRVGVHLGDVVEEADGDLMGDGVNVAARLEGICEQPGFACLRTPTGRSGRGSSFRWPTSGRKASRTSPSRCARICCAWARLRRKNHPKLSRGRATSGVAGLRWLRSRSHFLRREPSSGP